LTYCIDTSAILDGWVRYYPPDVFPALWTSLEAMIEDGELIAPEEVLHEIEKKEDALHKWAKTHEELFHPLDERMQRTTARILTQFPRLVDSEKERNRADPFVIALAMIRNCPVVTGEKNNGTPDRPKIPIVCDHFGVRYINLLGLIREKKWRFR
jgi:predicted nucleic acid-binding protein